MILVASHEANFCFFQGPFTHVTEKNNDNVSYLRTNFSVQTAATGHIAHESCRFVLQKSVIDLRISSTLFAKFSAFLKNEAENSKNCTLLTNFSVFCPQTAGFHYLLVSFNFDGRFFLHNKKSQHMRKWAPAKVSYLANKEEKLHTQRFDGHHGVRKLWLLCKNASL